MNKLFNFILIFFSFLNLNSETVLLYFDFNSQSDADTFVNRLTVDRTYRLYSSRRRTEGNQERIRVGILDYNYFLGGRFSEYLRSYLGYYGAYGILRICDYELAGLDWRERARELGIY